MTLPTLTTIYLLTRWNMTTTVKTCFKCSVTKPLTEFYRHARMGDGHLNKCKECTKADVYNHRHVTHRESVLAYDRERYQRPERKEAVAKIVKTYLVNFPDRRFAHTSVSNAVRSGKLERLPCFICGELKTEAHHPDYSRPLDVVWLCTQHHKDTHAMHYYLTKKAA